jgi:hypothetical protein
LSGTGGWAGVVLWQGMQASMIFFTMESIDGNYIFSRINCLVLVEPWWPSWARSMACFLRDVGITIRVDFRIRSLSLLTVLIGFYLHKCWNVVSSKCW